MIPGGWIVRRTPVLLNMILSLGIIEETLMNSIGRNSQKEARKTKETNGPVEDVL